MRLFYLAYRNMVSKPLNLLLSMLLLTLSISLVTFVLQLSEQMGSQLQKNIAPFDMVVGAKGSPLQLVLASVLHIDAPTGNIRLEDAKPLMNHPFVDYAVPVSYGDNFKGQRILGTEQTYLEKYKAELAEGDWFAESFEVVLGAQVAQKWNLNLGDQIIGTHGLVQSDLDPHDDHPFLVKGILKPNGSVLDQLVITSLESVWDSHAHESESQEVENSTEASGHQDHEHEGEGHAHDHENEEHEHEHEHDEDLEITSLLVKFKSPMGMVQIPRFINENTVMQSALPGIEIQRLIGLLGSGVQTINGIALAILLVSGLSIFISLLKTIRERKQELALLRVYGFRTGQLLRLVLGEGLLLTVLGLLMGWLIGRIGVLLFSIYTQNTYGFSLTLVRPSKEELFIFLGTIVIAAIASLLAALPVFKLNVANTLSDA